MSLTQLQYVVAVADTGHFAKAAKRCHVSQPTLSVQLQKYEKELGVEIFDRSRHPILPTDIGRKIVAQAREVLLQNERIGQIVGESRGVVEGSYHLGMIPTVASSLVPLMYEAFESSFPLVELTIEEMTTSRMISALNEDVIDGGIAATPLGDPAFREEPLYYEDFLVYACRNFGKDEGSLLSVRDIDVRALLLLKDGHCFRDQVLQLCDVAREGAGGIRYEGGDFNTLMRLVDSGCGMTLIPQLVAGQIGDARSGSRVYRFRDPVPKREISLVTKRLFAKRHISEAIRQTIDGVLPDGIARTRGRKGRLIDPVD